jgi:hypothetical protein
MLWAHSFTLFTMFLLTARNIMRYCDKDYIPVGHDTVMIGNLLTNIQVTYCFHLQDSQSIITVFRLPWKWMQQTLKRQP